MFDPQSEAREAITRLEARARRQAGVSTMLACALGVLLAWTLTPRARLDAQSFMLFDAHHHWRGALMTSDEGAPMVRLNDARGRARLLGLLTPDGRLRLRLADSSGVNRLGLELDAQGRPAAWLVDTTARLRLRVRELDDHRVIAEYRDGEAMKAVVLPPAPPSHR